MKTARAKSKESAKPRETPKVAPARPALWPYALGFVAALVAVFEIYAPALRGPFLFDDGYLPFNLPSFAEDPLRYTLRGVRPVLQFSYWLNYMTSALEPFAYHAWNVFIHTVAASLVFAISRKLLLAASTAPERARDLALFAAAVFLLHPAQTESVAYVSGRSEALSVAFFLGALTVFLYGGATIAVLLMAALAALSKEHTVVLPAALLLTDYYWNPGFSLEGIRRHKRLYLAIGAGALFAGAWVMRGLLHARTAGFGVAGLTWYQYFFTQWRALFVYLRLFVLPVGQTVDYDFAISKTPFDHGAAIWLVIALTMLAAALYFRKRYPLASYGFLLFLVLLAPTSSIVPIKDPVAERRLYLPFIGLLLIVLEGLRRLRWDRRTMAMILAPVLVVLGVATYERNKIWSDLFLFWQDAVAKSPAKARPHFQLAFAYYQAGQCDKAVAEFRRVSELERPAYDLLVDWALAYDCIHNSDEALAKLSQAAAMEQTAHVNALIGMVNAKEKRWDTALAALARAEKLDLTFEMTYIYRGNIFASMGNMKAAGEEFQRALHLNPNSQAARDGLTMVRRSQR